MGGGREWVFPPWSLYLYRFPKIVVLIYFKNHFTRSRVRYGGLEANPTGCLVPAAPLMSACQSDPHLHHWESWVLSTHVGQARPSKGSNAVRCLAPLMCFGPFGKPSRTCCTVLANSAKPDRVLENAVREVGLFPFWFDFLFAATLLCFCKQPICLNSSTNDPLNRTVKSLGWVAPIKISHS